MPFTAAAAGTAGLTAGQALAANVAVGAIVAGTATSVIGQREAAKTTEQIAEQNAAALRVQGEQETQAAAEEQRRIKKEGERRKSRLRVLAANAGIDLVGTPLLLEEELAGEFEEERIFAGQAGRQRRFGAEFESVQERARGRSIRRISPFRTGTSILTGVTRVASLSA